MPVHSFYTLYAAHACAEITFLMLSQDGAENRFKGEDQGALGSHYIHVTWGRSPDFIHVEMHV